MFWSKNKDSEYHNVIKKILPKVKGKITENVLFSKLTWFGVGGVADFMFNPSDNDDITHFLKEIKAVPTVILGGCSNVLIRDGGILGCVIRLGKEFSEVKVEGTQIKCGGGAKNPIVAKIAMENGIGGFEFLNDIPGTIGGALRMNAGAHGNEMRNLVKDVDVFDNGGNFFNLDNAEMMFSYRRNDNPSDWLFSGATLQGFEKPSEEIKQTMDEFRKMRQESQPIGVKTAGCTFKNPLGSSAWKLIDQAGCRGMQVGGAIVSDKHCNFIVNTGTATASDIENLGEKIQEKVLSVHGINLEWEIRRIGVNKR